MVDEIEKQSKDKVGQIKLKLKPTNTNLTSEGVCFATDLDYDENDPIQWTTPTKRYQANLVKY